MKYLLAYLLLSASTFGGTIFQVRAESDREEAVLTGTLDIDTIDGLLDAVDLVMSPVSYGGFTNNEVHWTRGNVRTYPWGITQISSGALSPIAGAGLLISFNLYNFIGYEGGEIKPAGPLLSQPWSALMVTGAFDSHETSYWRLQQGTLTIVPEPSAKVLFFIGIALIGLRRRL